MCGIAAQYGNPDAAAGERMLRRLVHRGPDDHGSVAPGKSWLGHRRLSIVDVEGGAQPLVSESGNVWLVGNGEVYNHAEVREGLDGRAFRTRSDNEVALHLIEERGPAALAELEGMFAFATAGEDGSFLAARDPVGIKPLYWAQRNGDVRFASEIRTFDRDWLPLVRYFPPGCYWTPDGGVQRFARAAPISHHEGADTEHPDPTPAALDRTREELIAAVERQMMGDVPVGVFLSGGLDSSLVAAIAAPYLRERGQRLKTFAVGTADSPDLEAARFVAEHLDTEHHERIYTADDAIEALPQVVRVIESFDPSLVRSAVPNYLLAELTSRHVKVVLTGEGADELFAGYEYLHELDDDALHAELVRTIEGLHNLNLQRCDRVTMAHGLEARVPFLDTALIRFALSLPPDWKIADSERPEKRLLREAFTGWLPERFLWREKVQFGDGSGASEVLKDLYEGSVSEAELVAERDQVDPPLRTREELAYWRMLRDGLAGVETGETIGRFATA
jgi:asparagine synthase (glutamine-hydrolysing)